MSINQFLEFYRWFVLFLMWLYASGQFRRLV